MSKNREPVGWFTSRGKHVPIFEGETKEDAVKRLKEGINRNRKQKLQKEVEKQREYSSARKEEKEAFRELHRNPSAENKEKARTKSKLVKQKHKELADAKSGKSESVGKFRPISKDESGKVKILKNKPKQDEKSQPKQDIKDTKQRQMDEAKERADKLNADKQYEESIRLGNKVGIKDNHLTFKGKDVPKLNTAGAMHELETEGTNSLDDFLDGEGNMSPERLAVHREIIEKYFGDKKPYKPGEEKKALFTGGGGASGKGTLFTKHIENVYSSNDNPLIVDADTLKEMLNEYDFSHNRPNVSKQLTDVTTGWYHEESSALAKQIYKLALDNNFPVMYDGTATGGKYYDTVVKPAIAAGYKTEMNFLFSDWSTVRNNSMIRYLGKSNRLVPLDKQLRAHSEAYDAVLRLSDKFDNFAVWDNRSIGMDPKTGKDIFNQQKIAESTKGGKLKILDGGQKAWDFFSSARLEFALTPEKTIEFSKLQKSIESYKKKMSKTDDKYSEFASIKVDKGRKWLKENAGNSPNKRR